MLKGYVFEDLHVLNERMYFIGTTYDSVLETPSTLLYSAKLDGKDKKHELLIPNNTAGWFTSYEGILYHYEIRDDGIYLCGHNILSGKTTELYLPEEVGKSAYINDDWIYCENQFANDNAIYRRFSRIRMDGSQMELIDEGAFEGIAVNE